MNDGAGGLWDALRLVYAPARREGSGPTKDPSPAPLGDDLETRIDLAEERAAILEFEGGFSRAKAAALAYRAHGLTPPGAKT